MTSLRERVTRGTWKNTPAEFRRDRLIISARPGANVAQALNAAAASITEHVHGAPDVDNPPDRPWAVLEFPPLADAATRIPALAAAIAARPDILYAEPDFIGTGHLKPDDSLYGSQWWAEKIGIEALWDITQGAPHVLLAIVDSGISIPAGGTNPDHADLTGPRFIVRHKLGGVNVHHDYVEKDDVPQDEHGHGTHVTGIAAAAGNNSTGVAGVNWNSSVYVARVLDEKKNGSVGAVKHAVDAVLRYAAAPVGGPHGFLAEKDRRVVINLSLGFTTYSEALEQMCKEADTGQVVLCVAAGSRDAGPTNIDYPAAFAASFDHVIAVGATDERDKPVLPVLNSYDALTIMAPGQNISSTIPTYDCTYFDAAPSPYDATSGSSQACAIVSGVVSLIWSASRKPTPGQIKLGLRQTARVLYHNLAPYRRIDVGQMVTLAGQNPPWWP